MKTLPGCKNVASFMLLGFCLWMAEDPGCVEMKLVYAVFSGSPYLFDLRKAYKCNPENTFQPGRDPCSSLPSRQTYVAMLRKEFRYCYHLSEYQGDVRKLYRTRSQRRKTGGEKKPSAAPRKGRRRTLLKTALNPSKGLFQTNYTYILRGLIEIISSLRFPGNIVFQLSI